MPRERPARCQLLPAHPAGRVPRPKTPARAGTPWPLGSRREGLPAAPPEEAQRGLVRVRRGCRPCSCLRYFGFTEKPAQLLLGAKQMCFYRTHWQPKDARDFLVLLALEVEKGDHRAVFLGKRIDCGAQPRSFVERDRLLFGPGRAIGALGQLFAGVALTPVEPVAAGVVCNREDPRRKFRTRSEGPQAPKSFEKGLLRRIPGFLDVVQRSVGKVVNGAVVPHDERRKRVRIAPKRQCDQVAVLRLRVHPPGRPLPERVLSERGESKEPVLSEWSERRGQDCRHARGTRE